MKESLRRVSLRILLNCILLINIYIKYNQTFLFFYALGKKHPCEGNRTQVVEPPTYDSPVENIFPHRLFQVMRQYEAIWGVNVYSDYPAGWIRTIKLLITAS